MRGPFRRKRTAPREKMIWGECGVRGVRYHGDMPQDFVGRHTGVRYAFNERRPELGIDKRDLPGLAQDGGPENFEVRRDDGQFRPMQEAQETAPPVKAKPKPAPEPEEEEKPQEEAEVTDG